MTSIVDIPSSSRKKRKRNRSKNKGTGEQQSHQVNLPSKYQNKKKKFNDHEENNSTKSLPDVSMEPQLGRTIKKQSVPKSPLPSITHTDIEESENVSQDSSTNYSIPGPFDPTRTRLTDSDSNLTLNSDFDEQEQDKQNLNSSETSQSNDADNKQVSKTKNKSRTKKIVNFTSTEEDLDNDEDEEVLQHSNVSPQLRIKIKKDLQRIRETLPIYKAKDPLIKHLESNRVTILVGETGSGKSTQLPQFLSTIKSIKKGIAITQPRRVAAINLAKRVAEESGEILGDGVGYTVRFQNASHPRTKIKYLTDGMLLREIMTRKRLENYSVVVIDEAHERTVLTDLLMGFLKRLLDTRPDFKVVVMSATIDAERFSNFFNNAQILYVEGKMFNVQRFYLPDPTDDIIDHTIRTVIQINNGEESGDILVFLPGQEEIDKCVNLINDVALDLPKEAPLMVALPLYAAISPTQQQKVFESLPPRRRKIIFATNIAETSITVPGVRYVVDSGLRKVKVWKHELGLSTLLTTTISQASATQRTGRAGREAPGKCYRLYTEKDYTTLIKQTEPEIERSDISAPILMLKKAGIDDVLNWPWLQSPGRDAIVAALTKLYALAALDKSGKITELGKKMAVLPLSPHLSAVLINAQETKCLDDVIDIVACLSVDNLILNPKPDDRDEVNEKRQAIFSLGMKYGDLIMMKEMYQFYKGIKRKDDQKRWCKDLNISYRGISNVEKIKKQLREYMGQLYKNDTYNNDGESNPLTNIEIPTILKCFLKGFVSNSAIGAPDRSYHTVTNGQNIAIHPSSLMYGKKVDCIMFTEFVFTTRGYARNVSPIELDWLQEIAPHYLGRRIAT